MGRLIENGMKLTGSAAPRGMNFFLSISSIIDEIEKEMKGMNAGGNAALSAMNEDWVGAVADGWVMGAAAPMAPPKGADQPQQPNQMNGRGMKENEMKTIELERSCAVS